VACHCTAPPPLTNRPQGGSGFFIHRACLSQTISHKPITAAAARWRLTSLCPDAELLLLTGGTYCGVLGLEVVFSTPAICAVSPLITCRQQLHTGRDVDISTLKV
jgi:hypothetical protein